MYAQQNKETPSVHLTNLCACVHNTQKNSLHPRKGSHCLFETISFHRGSQCFEPYHQRLLLFLLKLYINVVIGHIILFSWYFSCNIIAIIHVLCVLVTIFLIYIRLLKKIYQNLLFHFPVDNYSPHPYPSLELL